LSNQVISNQYYVSENIKKCPKCSINIEKNQGCNHMTCNTKYGGCGHNFCWLCLNDWTNHSTCKQIKIETKDKPIDIDLFNETFYIKKFDEYESAKTLLIRYK